MINDPRDQLKSNNLTVGFSEAFLILIISMSFLFHFFISVFSGSLYIIIYALAIILFIICKPVILRKDYLIIPWLLSIVVILLSYNRSNHTRSNFIDVFVLAFGFLLVIFPDRRFSCYSRIPRCLNFFAVLFATGILLQALAPSLFNIIQRLLPLSYVSYQLGVNANNAGFSTNPGFSAGYIVSGILSTAGYINNKTDFRNRSFLIGLLTLALLFTNKRGHIIFLACSLLFCFMISSNKKKKQKKYLYVTLIILLAIIFFYVFDDLLLLVPGLNRIVQTFSSESLDGTDVTSGRLRLYVRAWHLFIENPIFGIGWGGFKETTTSSYVIYSVLDAHNIYLQVLCEAGIIGGISIFLSLIIFWIASKNAYIECIHQINPVLYRWKPLLYFSFSYQTFFLLYGLTGNVLYDQHYQILYLITCLIIMAYRKEASQKLIGL